MRSGWTAGAIAAALAAAGCGQGAGAPDGDILANALTPPAQPTPPAGPPPAAAGWIGRWTGPEGLFLDIAAISLGTTATR